MCILCVSGETGAVEDSCTGADLQPGEDLARKTGKTEDIQGKHTLTPAEILTKDLRRAIKVPGS